MGEGRRCPPRDRQPGVRMTQPSTPPNHHPSLLSPIPSHPTDMSSTDRRAAALAAAEARLRGDPTAHDLEEQARLDRLNPKEETWTPPSEKEDASAKRELGRLIDRGIVRDNGYKQAAEAVEVSRRLTWMSGSGMGR